MKRSILLTLFLLLSIGIWAQKKIKFPKNLKQTWATKQIAFSEWEEDRSSTIKIESKVIYIQEDGFYGYNDWLYDGDYSFPGVAEETISDYSYDENYDYDEEEYVENEEGLHTILSHIKWSKTSGVFLLEYIDYGTEYFRLLGYDQLDDDQVAFLIGYDFYSREEAESALEHMKDKFDKYGMAYYGEALFNQYQNLPTLSTLSESDYLIWWGRYIEEAKQKKIELSLGISENIPQGFLQGLFLDAGFNPFESPNVFISAIDKYGINEGVRILIRGNISEVQKVETLQLLNTKWYSMTGYGGPTEIGITDTEFYYKIADGDRAEDELRLPVADLIIGMTPKEGMLILGPAPDSIRTEQGFNYALLFFRELNAETVKMIPGDIAETLSEAQRAPLVFPEYGNALRFISQSKYDEYAALPSVGIMLDEDEFYRWEMDMERYMDSIRQSSNFDEYDYIDFYEGEYMFNFFISKGYNPITSMGNLERSRQYFSAVENLEYYREYLKDYQEELQEARRNNDLEEQRRIEQEIGSYKMDVVIAELSLKSIEAEFQEDFETKKQIDNQLNAFYELQSVTYSLDNAIYYKDEIQRTREEIENGTIYLDEEYGYDYQYYADLVKEYPDEIAVALVEVKDALAKVKPSDDIASFIKSMEKQISEIEEYTLVMDEDVTYIINLARQKGTDN